VIARRPRGFTLLEVMVGLALLGFALTVLMKSSAQSIFGSQEAHMMGVVTQLARGKMYDIEEKLLKEGFMDTEQGEEGQDFKEEGWPDITYDYKVERVELPSFDTLQAMAKGQGSGSAAAQATSGSGSGSALSEDMLGGFQNSALGGMMGMFGGGGGTDINDAQGGALIASQYTMFQDILEVAIRKISLTMKWKVLGRERDLLIVMYMTDQSAMDKVLKGFGSTELPDDSAGPGTGSGSGTGGTGNRGTGGTGGNRPTTGGNTGGTKP